MDGVEWWSGGVFSFQCSVGADDRGLALCLRECRQSEVRFQGLRGVGGRACGVESRNRQTRIGTNGGCNRRERKEHKETKSGQFYTSLSAFFALFAVVPGFSLPACVEWV